MTTNLVGRNLGGHPLERLPRELSGNIISYLSHRELGQASLAGKVFNKIVVSYNEAEWDEIRSSNKYPCLNRLFNKLQSEKNQSQKIGRVYQVALDYIIWWNSCFHLPRWVDFNKLDYKLMFYRLSLMPEIAKSETSIKALEYHLDRIQEFADIDCEEMFKAISGNADSPEFNTQNVREKADLIRTWMQGNSEKLKKITEFNLKDSVIRSLPKGFTMLINLTSITIEDCDFLCCLPNRLNLPALTSLKIKGCRNLSVLPNYLSFPALKELCLSDVNIKYLPKLSAFPDLRSLCLDKLPIECFPCSLDYCDRIINSVKLRIKDPPYMDDMPNMPALESFDENRSIIKRPPKVFSLPKLEKLVLCRVNLKYFSKKVRFPCLQELNLQGCSFYSFPKDLHLPALKRLFLCSSFFTNFSDFINLPQLRLIDLTGLSVENHSNAFCSLVREVYEVYKNQRLGMRKSICNKPTWDLSRLH